MTILEAITCVQNDIAAHKSDELHVADALETLIDAAGQLLSVKSTIIAETHVITDDDGFEWRVIDRDVFDDIFGEAWDNE